MLKARDALEKALQNQQSVPEVISQRIVRLDQELKDNRLALTKANQLLNWKKSLNPPPSNWWWNFKSTLFGDDDEPLPFQDRLWILAALACIGVAAGFVVNTTQTFQASAGKDKSGETVTVRSDAAQNSLVILQGGGLVALSASAVTKRGQKLVENLITSIPFIRPNWHAPATFFLSLTALGVAYSINKSLPWVGDWYYFAQGQKLDDEGQLYEAQERYLQAKKFFTSNDDKIKVSLALGNVYEQQGKLPNAIKEYTDALATDNPDIINHLARAMLLDGLEKVGWTGKIKEVETVRQAETYLQQVEKKISSQKTPGKGLAKDNNQNQLYWERLKKEIQVNRGFLYWSKIDFNKQLQEKDDSIWLEKAQENFKDAKIIEDLLPTNPAGRNARCYLELAEGLNNREKEKKLKALEALKKIEEFNEKLTQGDEEEAWETAKNVLKKLTKLLRGWSPNTTIKKSKEIQDQIKNAEDLAHKQAENEQSYCQWLNDEGVNDINESAMMNSIWQIIINRPVSND